jgi:hypothetical protein
VVSDDAPNARLDRPAALRLLEERPGGGPARIGQPGIGSEARQEREQRANAHALVEDVGGQHEVERRSR